MRQYKAIGNAVPPVLMWHVIKSLQKVLVIHQVNFVSLKQQYPQNIIVNTPVENIKPLPIDVLKDKNVLISLVKTDNMEQYLEFIIQVKNSPLR